ncbi:PREDICTED: uncharacterized protein LOC104816335 isoform X1 [Tarenaya hassleriana]|uniref:uncharacterized protein LOC104816335 isoform X1 n=1 Tax=Tarenaya hassleriana TaxID=28532 RepID=UPI00053C8E99|nr:PREDICTED: uncharacterized protein LOC104816335 isoform X1 [Tarenaya hassleriana]
MGVKILRHRIGQGSTGRHAMFRALVIASALSVVPLMEVMYGTELASENGDAHNDSALNLAVFGQALFSGPKLFVDKFVEPFWGKFETEKLSETVTGGIIAELMGLKLLHYDAKVLYIGRAPDLAVSAFKGFGFSDTHGVLGHPLFPFMRKNHVHELDFTESSFDLVISGDLDLVISPVLLVLEMERVLKPGGIGAVIVSSKGSSYMNGLVKSAISISSWLKQSAIVHVNYLDEFTLVVFKKNVTDNSSYFGEIQLPSDCGSVVNNKPYIRFLEPLIERKPIDFPKSITYLPKLIDISLKKRLVYIDIGAGEHLNASLYSSWFLPSYPVDSKAFNIYFVDHNTSVMLSYVKKPGVTFVYHPGLAGDKATSKNVNAHEDLEPFPEDEGFDFLAWFEETVKYADFVVLKMNTSEVEMKFLSGLLESGAICFIDELFLRCPTDSDCLSIPRALRSRGVFVHQWWGE